MAINVFRCPAPPVGLIKTIIPLSSFSCPGLHFSPSSVAKAHGSNPLSVSTTTTTIWLEVESLKAFNLYSIANGNPAYIRSFIQIEGFYSGIAHTVEAKIEKC